jgi:ABC-2 type transport system ATP-binding protein
MDLLKIENVTKRYSAHTALDDVSLSVPRGPIYGLLGPNGAGKTTLIRAINRITLPDAGRVIFDGHQITDQDIYQIGYLPEERGLYKKMKVGEQAIFFAQLKGLSRREAIARLKEWFVRMGIESWWNRKVEDLSKGMAQKVQFITTVLHEPKLLIFDEPFSGFDPINANILKQEILRLRDKGATVIFSTHNMSSVEEICDHITLINKSRNILSGSVDEVRRRFGENVFEVTYSGQAATFEQAMQPVAEMLSSSAVADSPYTCSRIRIKDTASVRDSITVANEAVELRSFREVIPSMNDIFIRAVEGTL